MRLLSVVVPVKDEQDNVGRWSSASATRSRRPAAWETRLRRRRQHRRHLRGARAAAAAADPRVKVVRLRRNFGQTAATQAGLDAATGDVIVTMDGDLQNDPADIPRLLAKLDEGYDAVLGQRHEPAGQAPPAQGAEPAARTG